MTTTSTTTTNPPRRSARRQTPQHQPSPWLLSVACGVAVQLASSALVPIVQTMAWTTPVAGAVAVVVVMGIALHRAGPIATVAGQLVAVLMLVTLVFTGSGILGVVPGPAAWAEFGAHLAAANEQISTGVAPVPATPGLLFLLTVAYGLVAVAVHGTAVFAKAPAAAGVPLLATFAVPAAVSDELLPWWALAATAVGFGLLLIAGHGIERRLRGASIIVAAAVAAAVAAGTVTGFVGTSGRFGNQEGTGAGTSIGLSPFTALRGQLEQPAPTELLRVRGLDQASYLRVLTLRQFVAGVGWQAVQPAPGVVLPGPVRPNAATPGRTVDVEFENRGFRDYWLPLYGDPVEVSGVPEGRWLYDEGANIGYSARPREDGSWRERAILPAPTAEQLRGANSTTGSAPEYLDVSGVDPRVAEIAADVVAGQPTTFDKAMVLQNFFTDSANGFRYSLQTAPSRGDDALVEFLTFGKTGYCEQYASAMAIMLRTVKVPSRVAVGFTAGVEIDGYRSISTSDAHAWVEAWFPGVGWTSFDPTPLTDGRRITPPYVQEAMNEGASSTGGSDRDERSRDEQQAEGQTPQQQVPEEALDPGAPTAGADTGPGLPPWPVIALIVAALLGLLLAGVPALVRRVRRTRRLAVAVAGGPEAADAAWAEVLADSVDRGVEPPASDTVRATARRLVREHRLDDDVQQDLRRLVTAVEGSWYGESHPEQGALGGPLAAVRAGIAKGTRLSLRGRVLPHSVLQGLWRRRVSR